MSVSVLAKPVASFDSRSNAYRSGFDSTATTLSGTGRTFHSGFGADLAHVPFPEFEFGFRQIQDSGGDLLRLLRDHLRRDMEGRTRHDRPTRGESADGITEPAGITRDDLDVGDLDSEVVRNDLGERGLWP